ncbi:hypothetical protein VSU19_19810 [Verrucomicrobiales bacterium BCK34]|nr:hypothetical protein [Verrucomicrobiales bacterium BCK34]
MARSVSHHPSAIEVIYLHGITFESDISYPDDFDFQTDEGPAFDYLDFSDFLDDLQETAQGRYPSFHPCDRWVGREDHVILENGAAEVSVAEYGGLISISLAPKDGSDWDYDRETARNANWTGRISTNFRKLLRRRFKPFVQIPLGTASNGESFFRPWAHPEKLISSKEGELW